MDTIGTEDALLSSEIRKTTVWYLSSCRHGGFRGVRAGTEQSHRQRAVWTVRVATFTHLLDGSIAVFAAESGQAPLGRADRGCCR